MKLNSSLYHFTTLPRLLILSFLIHFPLLTAVFADESDHFSQGAGYYIQGNEKEAIRSLEQALTRDSNHRQARELLKLILIESIQKDIERGKPKESFSKAQKMEEFFPNDPETYRLSKRAGYPEKIIPTKVTVTEHPAEKKQKLYLKSVPFTFSNINLIREAKQPEKLPITSPVFLTEDSFLKLENRLTQLQDRWEKEKKQIQDQAERQFNQQLSFERDHFRQLLIAWSIIISAGFGLVTLMIFVGMSYRVSRIEKKMKSEMKNALTLFQKRLNREGMPFAEVLRDESTPQGFYNFLQHHCQRIFTALELGESNFALETKSIITKLIETIKKHKKEYIGMALAQVTSSNYFLAHPVNVAIFSTVVGLRSALDEEECQELTLAALLHDVGVAKMIPILSRARISGQNLKPEELHQVQEFRQSEEEVLSAMVDFDERTCQRVAAIISKAAAPLELLHIETDQPNKVEMIATIVNICESFETSIHYRPYHQPLTPLEGIEKLQKSLKDPYARKALRWLMEELQIFSVGALVKLSTGKTGEILSYDVRTGRMEIVIRKGSIGRFTIGEQVILTKNSPIHITEILPSG